LPDLSSRWDAVPRVLVELEIDLEPENENTEIEMKNESDEKRWNENAAIVNEEMRHLQKKNGYIGDLDWW
jgi:hypothetical protein